MSYLERIAEVYSESAFSDDELLFYKRHLLLPGVGTVGQQKMKAARVLVVGAGGLGCPLLQALAGSGVGLITIVDGDTVSLSNVSRQWLHTAKDVGQNKAESAARKLRELNPYIEIRVLSEMLSESNIAAQVALHDIIVDATDDRDIRYYIDEECAAFNRPWVHAALYRDSGQVSVFWAKYKARFDSLFPEKSAAPSCAGAGILGASASVIANLQALEVIKLITACAPPQLGILQSLNTGSLTLQAFRLPGVLKPKYYETGKQRERPDLVYTAEMLRQDQSIGRDICLLDLRPIKKDQEACWAEARHCSIEELMTGCVDFKSIRGRVILMCEEGIVSGMLAEALRSRHEGQIFHLQGGSKALAGEAF